MDGAAALGADARGRPGRSSHLARSAPSGAQARSAGLIAQLFFLARLPWLRRPGMTCLVKGKKNRENLLIWPARAPETRVVEAIGRDVPEVWAEGEPPSRRLPPARAVAVARVAWAWARKLRRSPPAEPQRQPLPTAPTVGATWEPSARWAPSRLLRGATSAPRSQAMSQGPEREQDRVPYRPASEEPRPHSRGRKVHPSQTGSVPSAVAPVRGRAQECPSHLPAASPARLASWHLQYIALGSGALHRRHP